MIKSPALKNLAEFTEFIQQYLVDSCIVDPTHYPVICVVTVEDRVDFEYIYLDDFDTLKDVNE